MIRTLMETEMKKKRKAVRSIFELNSETDVAEPNAKRLKKVREIVGTGFTVSEQRKSEQEQEADDDREGTFLTSTLRFKTSNQDKAKNRTKIKHKKKRNQRSAKPENDYVEIRDSSVETFSDTMHGVGGDEHSDKTPSTDGKRKTNKEKRERKKQRIKKETEVISPVDQSSNVVKLEIKDEDSAEETDKTKEHSHMVLKKKKRKFKIEQTEDEKCTGDWDAESFFSEVTNEQVNSDHRSGGRVQAENHSETKSSRRKDFVRQKLTAQRLQKGQVMLSPKAESKIYKLKKALHKKGLPEDEIRRIIRQKRRSEELSFRHASADSNVCFRCRQPGHRFADCELVVRDEDQGRGVCFRCGSTEHVLRDCTARSKKGRLPYAKCFVCGQQGHISRECPSNPKGAFPRGGRCNVCGSINHLKRDCPQTKNDDEYGAVTAKVIKFEESADALDED